MDFPKDYLYTSDHEWITIDENTATVGISHYALEQLGDVVHIEFPTLDETFDIGDSFGTIESTKTVSDLYLPVGGTISEVNEDLLNNLESLVEDPYGEAWLVKVDISKKDDSKLMNKTDYQQFVSEQ